MKIVDDYYVYVRTWGSWS